MSNVLRIEGRQSPIINARLNVELGIYLTALYHDRAYDLRMINAFGTEGTISSAVLRFDPENREYVRGGLNHIVLMTSFRGKYKAIGASRISTGGKPEFYKIGDDLEIIVDSPAEEAIQSLQREYIELVHALFDGEDHDYGMPPNFN